MYKTKVSVISCFFSKIGLWFPFLIAATVIAGTFNNFFSYLAFALSAAGITFLSEEDALCMMMFAMPFSNIFKSSPEAQSFFTYLLFFFILYMLYKKKTIDANFFVAFLVLTAFLVFQTLRTINLFRTIKFIANLLFIYFAVNIKSKDDSRKVFLFYILGIVVSSAVVALELIPNLSNYFQVQDLGYDYDYMIRFSGLYADPNYYSINVIISLCLIILLNHKNQLSMIPTLILAALMVAFAIMTFSKSAFLMLIFPLFLFLYSKIKQKKYLFAILFLIICTGFIVYVMSGNVPAFKTILSRLEQSDASSLTTGRSDLWLEYINYLSNSISTLLFGAGFGAPVVGAKAAHNTYIDLAYYLGIIGTAILLYVLLTISQSTGCKTKNSILNYSIWITVMIMYFFLSELFYFDLAFHILLAILATKTSVKPIHQENNI